MGAPSPGASQAWFYEEPGAGRPTGPLGVGRLRELWAAGRVDGRTLVFRQGMPTQAPVAEVPALLAELRGGPPAPEAATATAAAAGRSPEAAVAQAAAVLAKLQWMFRSSEGAAVSPEARTGAGGGPGGRDRVHRARADAPEEAASEHKRLLVRAAG